MVTRAHRKNSELDFSIIEVYKFFRRKKKEAETPQKFTLIKIAAFLHNPFPPK